LQEKYKLRNKGLAQNSSRELAEAEHEIILIQRVIARHRLRCARCRSQDVRSMAFARPPMQGAVALSRFGMARAG
jgi:hypothetical protein